MAAVLVLLAALAAASWAAVVTDCIVTVFAPDPPPAPRPFRRTYVLDQARRRRADHTRRPAWTS